MEIRMNIIYIIYIYICIHIYMNCFLLALQLMYCEFSAPNIMLWVHFTGFIKCLECWEMGNFTFPLTVLYDNDCIIINIVITNCCYYDIGYLNLPL